jgi:RNA-splicing ligase RtcB
VRIATKKLAAEEAPESYKDVSQVRQQLGNLHTG